MSGRISQHFKTYENNINHVSVNLAVSLIPKLQIFLRHDDFPRKIFAMPTFNNNKKPLNNIKTRFYYFLFSIPKYSHNFPCLI